MSNRIRALAGLVVVVLSGACATDPRGEPPDPTRLHYPSGIALDPGGDYAYVVSTNFDSAYTGGTVVPVNLSTQLLEPQGAIEVGGFGGDLVLAQPAAGGLVGFVASREKGRLETFAIDRSSGSPVLACGPRDGEWPFQCDDEHVIKDVDAEPPDEDPIRAPGDDPYAVALGQGVPGGGPLLYLASIEDGIFTVMTLDEGMKPQVSMAAELSGGLHSIAEGGVVNGRRRVYVSNRYYPLIHVVDVGCPASGGACEIVTQASLGITQITSSGDYFRGLAVSRDQRMLFAVRRSPPALAVFDLAEDGTALERGLVALQGAPANVALLSRGGDQADLAYVTDYARDSIYCVDPETMNVVDHFQVADGPYGIAIGNDPSGLLPRAYVTAFEDDLLSVVDLDPNSPTWHQEIARIK